VTSHHDGLIGTVQALRRDFQHDLGKIVWPIVTKAMAARANARCTTWNGGTLTERRFWD